MKIQSIKSGFTLIELLVVITIIGILATGATTVFTSQIQKARDTTRITDLNAVKSAVEQVYQDNSEYPHSDQFVHGSATITGVDSYMETLPKDPKHGQPCNDGGTAANAQDCGYAYVTGVDSNGIDYGEYELSTAFENEGNVLKKASLDNGGLIGELTRFEIGLDIATTSPAVAAAGITPHIGACTLACAAAAAWTDLIVLNGNPTGALECL